MREAYGRIPASTHACNADPFSPDLGTPTNLQVHLRYVQYRRIPFRWRIHFFFFFFTIGLSQVLDKGSHYAHQFLERMFRPFRIPVLVPITAIIITVVATFISAIIATVMFTFTVMVLGLYFTAIRGIRKQRALITVFLPTFMGGFLIVCEALLRGRTRRSKRSPTPLIFCHWLPLTRSEP